MKKILIFSHEFPPRLGGAGGVALQLANGLTKRGYEVTVVTSKEKNINYEEEFNFKVYPVKTIRYIWFISYFLFFIFYNVKKFDKIILNDGGAIYSAGISFRKETLKKCLTYIHGVDKHLKSGNILLKIMRYKLFFVKVLDNSDKLICVSNFIRKKFFDGEKMEKYKDKIKTFYNGVDKNEIYYIESNLKKQLNILDNQRVLMSVSRLTYKKGYLKKYELFKRLLVRDRNLIWVIVGDGDYKNEFEALIKSEGYQEKVKFIGKKRREQLKYYYSIADIFWLLSEYDEAFPLVYYEAQICKTIPIGWNNAGVKEVINSNYGLLANNGDEVIEFIIEGYKKVDTSIMQKYVLTSEKLLNNLEMIL